MDPRKTYFACVTIGNCDGTVDLTEADFDPVETEDEAITQMRENAKGSCDLPSVVYRIQPMHISRRRYEFEKVKNK